MHPRRPHWINIGFVLVAHLLAVSGIVYLAAFHFSWWTVGLAAGWYAACGLAITGGYHRLFSHRSFEAVAPLRALSLLFGAGAVQNSALKWSIDHRIHHEHTDTDDDPYNIRRGFWWAHVGWLFFREVERPEADATDLLADPLVRFQHKHYLALAVLFGVALPGALAALWGDVLGGVLVAGFLRLVLQWHATFSVNSFAHTVGNRPYCLRTSARDSVVTALISLGEGYHNFHHRFQADYRNGVRWFHFDPTKWFVWTMSKVGATRRLRRTPSQAIERARAAVAASLGQTVARR